MTDKEVSIVLGALLHDIGKVIYRRGDDRRNHSQSGHDYLKDNINIENRDVLEAVRFHHAEHLKNAEIDNDSSAYIIYIADNIASAVDRRKNDTTDYGFKMSIPLQSVFNILNGNNQNMYYQPKTLSDKCGINFPSEKAGDFTEAFYTEIISDITENLKGLLWNREYINSLLVVLEANLSYIPSSTALSEQADISLYDHLKLTAAIAECIFQYMQEKKIYNYKEYLYNGAGEFYGTDAFMLYSMDISGIQKFIYTIHSQNALKTLRARSFYLEIMMEHITDGLLDELNLSRTNLIYSGGGHCYIILPNTQKAAEDIEKYMKKLNAWLADTFQTSLFVAYGSVPCSCDTLKNIPSGSYSELFKSIGNQISKMKNNRYSASDIMKFNSANYENYERECKVCHNIADVNEDGECPICEAIKRFSNNILYDDFFAVTNDVKEGLPLPGNCTVAAFSKDELIKRMGRDDNILRVYSKNDLYTGKRVSTKLWVGDYTTGKDFKTMAAEAEGIDRIGILRADVDNLGQAFVAGFENKENNNRYVTLSRTAVLSRQLSLFFKHHINYILSNPEFSLDNKEPQPRNVAICYSGGDDLFIVGAWNEIIEAAVDINRALKKYTQGTLTLSAGIGIYDSGYPISSIASEVAAQESKSKMLENKNAVTLFEDGEYHNSNGRLISDGTYKWQEFEEEVIGEKYDVIKTFFDNTEDRGINFMYNLLNLIRSRKDKINFARYVYLLSRLEPDNQSSDRQKELYKDFAAKMYGWIQNDKDCRQLKTAINIYAYITRENGGGDNEN